MDNQNSKCSSQAGALAFLEGAVAGVVAGFLVAPRSGEETHRVLKGYARKVEKKVLEKPKERRAAIDETIERGKWFIAERLEDVETATKTGREIRKGRLDTSGD